MNLTVKEVLERYGPALAMIAALVALVVFIPGNADDTAVDTEAAFDSGAEGTQELIDTGDTSVSTGDDSSAATPAGGTSSASAGGGGAGAGSGSGGSSTPESAAPQDTSQSTAPAGSGETWGPGNYPAPGPDTPCRSDGAMPAFSQYSPTCLPIWTGDNGGATSQGVTADSIKLVWYNDQVNAATQAALTGAGAGDSDATIEHDIRNFVRYFNLHVETYGREVKLEVFEGTGDPLDDNVLRADATAIANDMKPFAVFHHYVSMGEAFSEELAANGVMCLCTTSATRSMYLDNAPYAFTALPTLDEYFTSIAEYVGKRLNGSPPKHAGSAPPGKLGFNETRRFGLVYMAGRGDDVDPRRKPVVDRFKQELAQYGASLSAEIAYQYDISRAQEQSRNIIAQLIDAGVNTVIFVGEPLSPVFLTKEADTNAYFPEWLITGTGLTDTTFFGRTYSQTQWNHAFGMSPLWVFAPLVESSGWNASEHIEPGGEKGVGVNVTQSPIQTLFTGIHYAGPNLTAQNVSAGLIAAPAVGGTINAPLVKYTAENPSAIKDWVEVWWDPQRRGMDEQDRQGTGMLVKAQGGARYQTSQWPQQPPFAFEDDPNPITTTDKPEILPHGGHNHDGDPPCRSCG